NNSLVVHRTDPYAVYGEFQHYSPPYSLRAWELYAGAKYRVNLINITGHGPTRNTHRYSIIY
ncbi:MAG: hypothetical protein VX643_05590, partial [Chloroflexota bacterium]|nr:hypothetical protein [Chloroflexota bacterium]